MALANNAVLFGRLTTKVSWTPAAIADPRDEVSRGGPSNRGRGILTQLPIEISSGVNFCPLVSRMQEDTGEGTVRREICYPASVRDQTAMPQDRTAQPIRWMVRDAIMNQQRAIFLT